MIAFNFEEILNQYSLIGLPFVLLVLGALVSRFIIKDGSL